MNFPLLNFLRRKGRGGGEGGGGKRGKDPCIKQGVLTGSARFAGEIGDWYFAAAQVVDHGGDLSLSI